MKFCCEHFKGNYQSAGIIDDGGAQKEVYPHIQIVKLGDTMIYNNHRYRYLFVCGFPKDHPPYINMKRPC